MSFVLSVERPPTIGLPNRPGCREDYDPGTGRMHDAEIAGSIGWSPAAIHD